MALWSNDKIATLVHQRFGQGDMKGMSGRHRALLSQSVSGDTLCHSPFHCKRLDVVTAAWHSLKVNRGGEKAPFPAAANFFHKANLEELRLS